MALTLCLFACRFVGLLVMGVVNICVYPSVLSGFLPHYAVNFFRRRGWTAWKQLGAVVLCVTGVEAMYADLGHFGKKAVRASWIGLVCPALLCTYLGQAAVLCNDASTIDRLFLACWPDVLHWPILILSTMATVIASQALISGSFSLVAAAIKFDFLPHLRVQHTSEGHEGQIYLPMVNNGLMLATVVVVLLFQHSSALANAYGLAVCFVMLFTTLMYGAVMHYLWNCNWWRMTLFMGPFMCIDSMLLSANILKVFNVGRQKKMACETPPCFIAFR